VTLHVHVHVKLMNRSIN